MIDLKDSKVEYFILMGRINFLRYNNNRKYWIYVWEFVLCIWGKWNIIVNIKMFISKVIGI